MRVCEACPFVRQAVMSRMSLARAISYKLRTRDHRLFYVLGGDGNIVIEGESYPLRAGMIVLFRSGTEYMWQLGEVRYLSVNFDYTYANSHLKSSFHVERSESVGELLEPGISFEDAPILDAPVVLYGAAAIEPMIEEIVNEFSLGGSWRDEYISSLMRAAVIAIARRATDAPDSAKPTAVGEILDYIRANYNRPIRNTDIADHLHLNPSYMNRVFRAHTGMNVRAYLIDYRINAAIELLSVGGLGVAEVAAAVGFSDVPHFIKTFKAHTGRTPGGSARAKV